MIVKQVHNDGSVLLETVSDFAFNTDDNEMIFINAGPASLGETVVKNNQVAEIYVYTDGGLILFTRCPSTGKPLPNFNV